MYRRVLSVLLGLVLLAPALTAHAEPAAQANTNATLTVLAGQAQVQPAGGSFAAGRDGQTVGVGSRVRTGAGGRALLTFFDGSTATLDPETEISLDRVESSGSQGGLLTGVGLAVGRVWAQVTSLVDRGSSLEVQAGSATAVAREGVTGFRVAPDGTVVCWDIDGAPMRVSAPAGEVELNAREQVTFPAGGGAPVVAPRAFGAGLLEVYTEGPIVARVVDPDGLTVGFPLSDLVINQVMDAWTSLPEAQPRFFRVPGPAAGLYQLVLEPAGSGAYSVRVVLGGDGAPPFEREWTGIARPGEKWLADLTIDARNGLPVVVSLEQPRPLTGEAPGRFIYP